MTTAATARRRLERRPDTALLGGVAAGIAEHIGVRPRAVRAAFVLLSVAGGFGVALYGAYWIVLPSDPDRRSRLPQWLEYGAGGVLLVASVAIVAATGRTGQLFVPILLACLGGALIWRQAGESERDRWLRLSRSSLLARGTDVTSRVRIVSGVALVVAGGGVVLARADVTAVRDGTIAVVVTLIGVALITGPWWMRMATQLGAERAERIRSQERADIAAHLHDSVLQTLALIQRNADSPREVARLARGQERELRTMLYSEPRSSGQLSEALRAAAAEVEDDYAISVEVVVVGDAPLDVPLAAATAAAREAMVNAAKHSQVTTVSLYAELVDGAAEIFVKDRGVGFDATGVADDRHGVRDSIVARVERHGGRTSVRSSPGGGTEIGIRMPTAPAVTAGEAPS